MVDDPDRGHDVARTLERDVGVQVLQPLAGRGQEDIRPAIELVACGQWGAEGAALVAAEQFIANAEANGLQPGGCFEFDVVGIVVDAVAGAAVVGLAGILQLAAGLDIVLEGVSQRAADAVGVARVGLAGGAGSEIQQIGVGPAREVVAGREGQVDEVGVGLIAGGVAGFAFRLGPHLLAEDTAHGVRVGVGQLHPEELSGIEADRVKGLLVLAPADITDETRVVQDHALASHTQRQVALRTGRLEVGLVQFGALDIGDHRLACPLGVEAGLVVLAVGYQ